MCGPFRLPGTLRPSKGPQVVQSTCRRALGALYHAFHRDLQLGRSLAYARGTAPPAVRLSPDTVLPLCNYLLPTSCSGANWLGGGGGKGPTQQAQTGPLFSSLSRWGATVILVHTVHRVCVWTSAPTPGHSGRRLLPNPGREAPRTTSSLLNMAPRG